MPIWGTSQWTGSSQVTRDYDCIVERRGRREPAWGGRPSADGVAGQQAVQFEKRDHAVDHRKISSARQGQHQTAVAWPSSAGNRAGGIHASIPSKRPAHPSLVVGNNASTTSQQSPQPETNKGFTHQYEDPGMESRHFRPAPVPSESAPVLLVPQTHNQSPVPVF